MLPQQVLATFEVGLPQDRTRLLQSPAFQRLPKELRNDLLKGKKIMHLSHSQIGESLPFMDRNFRWIYRLFCKPSTHNAILVSGSI